MDFRDHLFTLHPTVNEGVAFNPQMIEYQKHYNDTSSHRLIQPTNKAAYTDSIMQRKGINMTPAMQKLRSILKHDDIRKHPGTW